MGHAVRAWWILQGKVVAIAAITWQAGQAVIIAADAGELLLSMLLATGIVCGQQLQIYSHIVTDSQVRTDVSDHVVLHCFRDSYASTLDSDIILHCQSNEVRCS